MYIRVIIDGQYKWFSFTGFKDTIEDGMEFESYQNCSYICEALSKIWVTDIVKKVVTITVEVIKSSH